MGVGKYLLLFSVFVSFLYIVKACTMEGVDDWRVTQDVQIIDVQRGTFWNKTTSNILSMSRIEAGGSVNYANYLDVVWDADSGRFTISTSNGYEQYEENEISQTISFTVYFSCTGGPNALIFDISVQDTNNNPPTFMPTDQYEFTITPPLPPGFQITGCGGNDIVVRDVDLTTSSIEFTIEDNQYFEIEYAGRSLTDPKEYLASLKTKDLIRSLSQDIVLTITATDVDGTQDPPITRTATITVKADEAFLFPEEPVFAQPFYIATYADNQVVLDTEISLKQGYDEKVEFVLDGEYFDYFRLVPKGNEVSIEVKTELTDEILDTGRIILVVEAKREYTSGATATVIVQLPEEEPSFGEVFYKGTVQGGEVHHETITLFDYDGTDVQLLGEYAELFLATHSEGVVIIQGRGSVTLSRNVSHVVLQLQAETASAALVLDVKHSDEASFGKILYEGTVQGGEVYHEAITLSDYDGTDVQLLGEYADLFLATHSEGVVIVQGRESLTLSRNVSHVVLQLQAETASAALVLDIKHSDEASFGKVLYEGTAQGGEVYHEAITLSDYDGTDVQLLGEYADLFLATHSEGVVIIQGRGSVTLSRNISHVVLQLQAETASAALVLDVKHSDEASFGKVLYEGTVQGGEVYHEAITLSDYDGTDVQLLGEYADLFLATHSEGVVIVQGRESVTLSRNVSHVVLQLQAKTASAALVLDIKYSDEASFGKVLYEGAVQGGEVYHEAITLSGYDGTDVQLLGEYADLFLATHSEGVVIIQGRGSVTLSRNISHVVLQLQVETASAALVLDVKHSDEASFGKVLYEGAVQGGEVYHEAITLSDYDGTDVQLLGDYADLFSATHSEGLVIIRGRGTVTMSRNITHVVLQLQAETASAALVLDVKHSDEASFEKVFYEGTVQGGEVHHEEIILSDYDGTNVQLLGEYADQFLATHSEGVVIIQGRGSVTLSRNVSHLVLQLQAKTASAALVLDVKHSDEASFEKVFYEGTVQGGEVHHEAITLSDYDGTDVMLLGEYADLFSATHSEGVVIIQGRGSVTLSRNVSHVVLQLQAETASAVLLLDVKHSDETTFGKNFYEGTVQDDEVHHETITLSGFDGTDVQLLGEYANLFSAIHTEGVVIIQARGSVILSSNVSHVALQLQAETASAVLLLDVEHSVTSEASFGNILYKGSVQGGEVHHDEITLSGYDGTNVQLLGEYADLFMATHSEGVVIIQGRGSVILSPSVSHVALQLQAETASAVLLLDVENNVTSEASFGKVLYKGSVQGGEVNHDEITLSGYDGTDVQLLGEYADLFIATHSEGVVIIQGRGSVILSPNIYHVALQLQAKTANAVLLLDVENNVTSEASFGKVLYKGSVQGGEVHHDKIALSGYDGTDVQLLGEYADLFMATHSEGVVIIQGRGSVILSPNVSHVALQLQAGTASAVLLLDVENNVTSEASFGKVLYKGSVQGGEVHHDEIALSGYDGTDVQLLGEYADLFMATHSEGVVIIQGRGSVILSPNVSHVALQLQAGTASAVLLLDVENNVTSEASFGKVLYKGSVQGGEVHHDEITLSGYDGTDVQLLGEYADLFIATHSEGVVIIQGRGSVILSPNIYHVALQLQAETASAVLLLDVENNVTSEASFGKILYKGSVQGGEVHHDEITLSGYDGTDVQLLGEYADLFIATNSEGVVIIQGRGSVILSPNISHVALQLQAETASAVLLLDVENNVTSEASFGKVLYKGSVQGGEVHHDEITLSGYDGTGVQLLGEYADLFIATHSEGVVIIQGRGSVTLSPNVSNVALQLQAETASAVLLLDIENSVTSEASFGKVLYEGSVQGGEVQHEEITLSGYDGTTVQLLGEYADLFLATHSEGVVIIQGRGSVTLSPSVSHVTLQLQAETASAVLLLDVENIVNSEASFGKVLYEGSVQGGEVQHEEITLSGYDGTTVQLLGEYADLFLATHSEGVVIIQGRGSVTLSPSISHVALQLQAETASAVLLLDVENIVNSEASFGKVLYEGSVQGGEVQHEEITLSGYDGTTVQLLGEYADLFLATHSEGVVIIQGRGSVTLSPSISHVALQLQAETASAVLLLDVENIVNSEASFGKVLYEGSVQGGEVQHEEITLSGYDGTTVQLLGEYADLFLATHSEGMVIIQGRGSVTLSPSVSHVTLQLQAETASAVLLLDVENIVTSEASFGKVLYEGSVQGGEVQHEKITLSGYDGTTVQLLGEYADLFLATHSEGVVIIQGRGSVTLSPSVSHVALQLQAETASAVLLLDVENIVTSEASFGKVLYKGTVQGGEINHERITLSGYDGTDVQLLGEYADLFSATHSDGVVIIQGQGSVTLSPNVSHVVLQLQAKTASAVLLLDVKHSVTSDATFGKVLYNGILQGGEVHHDEITLSGYDGTDVQLLGENAALFKATHSEELVIVQARGSVTLSPNVSHVALQLQAETASAVLLLNVEHSENPDLPSVSFSSPSYVIQTDVTQTGTIGRVLATADNNEAVAYSLAIDNEHLLQRLSVSHYGELVLGARVNSGVYNFDVIATTVFTKVSASVPVHLTVDASTIIDDDKHVLPPLQILNRDEESPHENLIPFNASEFKGCRLSLSNRWPVDQNWLYVDENGLHANAIDREHESIAFMALSQIQVEVILQCEGDDVLSRSTRSVNPEVTEHLEHLGPYDYGDRKWIITDSINYNRRRSLVNLIVNDINDNAPIFIGKEKEPIVVGYPVSDLEERILPRALIQVEATDADVGENAAIVYWSTEDTLAVSPTTGSVHVRSIAGLDNDTMLTVNATDRNGLGLTGSLDILVKLVDTSHIAVVTIKNAFLDNEQYILSNLSAAVGYEVKALRSTVISDTESEEVNPRKKREATISPGASMQLYVYGLIEREPVNVDRLTKDISTGVIEMVIVASTVSLEDYLEICPLLGRDTALFVSTIVLAVLLFILIVAAAVLFFLKWRKEHYEEFTDENSLASQDESVSPVVDVSKPEKPTPRMNIEDLKRSERRLQEMLEAPLDLAPPPQLELQTSETPKESKVNIPEPPLVFQSFDKLKNADDTDDDDEFGEIKKNKRKSVVTFNENVEKIIHVEDGPDDDPDIEVFRL